MTKLAKHFVEVGHVNSWANRYGKVKIEITAPTSYLPPGTKPYALLETLDPQPVDSLNESTPSLRFAETSKQNTSM